MKAFRNHPRAFDQNYYVYPVISRRSQGLSLGINLNPEKDCNFHCVYCQVDRKDGRETFPDGQPLSNAIDMARLKQELRTTVDRILNGSIWSQAEFDSVPDQYRRFADIAFSGDGEPTTSPYFKEAVDFVYEIITTSFWNSAAPKMVLITNGTRLLEESLQPTFQKFYATDGELWVKLDAGNQKDFQQVAAVKMDFEKLTDHMLEFGRAHSIVLQCCLYARPNGTESCNMDDHRQTISRLVKAGCQISKIQLYTLARQTKIPGLIALSPERLEELAEALNHELGAQGPEVNIYP